MHRLGHSSSCGSERKAGRCRRWPVGQKLAPASRFVEARHWRGPCRCGRAGLRRAATFERRISAGRVEAVLTYWHYAARLEAAGATPLLSVADMVERLGGSADVPMLGYAFDEAWAAQHREAIENFLEASREAKTVLASSENEWERLTPLLGTSDAKVRTALKIGYRARNSRPLERRRAARRRPPLRRSGGTRWRAAGRPGAELGLRKFLAFARGVGAHEHRC